MLKHGDIAFEDGQQPLRLETSDPINFPEQTPDLEGLQLAHRPGEEEFVATAEGGKQHRVARETGGFQKIKHGHGNVMETEAPNHVFKIERMEHTLVKLDIVVPQIAVDDTQVGAIQGCISLLHLHVQAKQEISGT